MTSTPRSLNHSGPARVEPERCPFRARLSKYRRNDVPAIGASQEDLMPRAIPVVFLSALSFVVMMSVGSACGTGFRERGGFGGCTDEVGRQLGVLASAGDASSASGSGTPGRAIVAGGSAAARQGSWRQVTFWAGRGNKDTEAFVIGRPVWRITWSAKSAASAGALRISVIDGSDQSVSVV